MPEELLQRLRDIHYPAEPSWWPPAPGWWVLAILLLALTLWSLSVWRRRRTRRAPYAYASELLLRARQDHEAGKLGVRGYLDACNDILKRLLIHIQHNPAAVDASGARWLAELDRLHGGNQFSRGPGRWLGDARFAREVPDEVPDLNGLLQSFVKRLQNAEATAND